MKLKLSFLFIILLNSVGFSQNKVETLDLMGTTYTVCSVFPEEIIGEYEYEGNGDPKVLLNEEGTGYFQPHQTDPIKIKFWIDCDENGTWRKQVGGTGRYQYTLVVQYLDGTNQNYAVGKYDLMGVMIQPDLNRVAILGERYKTLN